MACIASRFAIFVASVAAIASGVFAATTQVGEVASSAGTVWDFEAGELAPWTVVSGNLASQPANAAWRGDVRFDQGGEWFIGTSEVAPGTLGQLYKLSGRSDNRFTGEIHSPTFEIDKTHLTFLIGGGYNPPDLRFDLIRDSDGACLRSATGFENEIMHRAVWDVSEHMGELCHLEIVDSNRSRWGHINVDEIRLVNDDELRAIMGPVAVGDFEWVYDPSVGEARPWYINDHCIIRGPDGLWHMFGITHFEPPNPLDEDHLAHATAEHLYQTPWDKHPFALDIVEDPWGEAHLWAPHVVEHEGVYHMFYCAGDEDHTRYKIHLATSTDLWTWERHPANPMVVDGYDARDPFVTRIGDQWAMYYTATSEPEEGNHIVACVLSDDLVHWGDRRVVFTHDARGQWGGPTESPIVVQRDDRWYLFVGPIGSYDGTDVYRSDDPFHWEMDDRVAYFAAHAPEVVRDVDGTWHVSRCGWRRGGLHMAPLIWNDGLENPETNFPPPQ